MSELLKEVFIGGNHLASALIGLLSGDVPDYHTELDVARKLFKDPNLYDAWVCWKTIMLVRDKFEGVD